MPKRESWIDVEKLADGSGAWLWRVLDDGRLYAAGLADSLGGAERTALLRLHDLVERRGEAQASRTHGGRYPVISEDMEG